MGPDPALLFGGGAVLLLLILIAVLLGGIAARAFLDASRPEPRPPRKGPDGIA